MPIDFIAQMNASQVPSPVKAPAPVAAAPAAATPAADARQDLPAAGQAPAAEARAEEVRQAVSRIQDYVQVLRRDLQFRVDEDLGRVVVTVLDSESGEVIRQIPSEEVLAVARSLDHARSGVLIDREV